MEKITTTIKREYLREIIAGRKRVEYREIKPYWTKRFDGLSRPFLLRMINGMQAKAPELTVVVRGIRTNKRTGNYELQLGQLMQVKYWDRKRERPSR